MSEHANNPSAPSSLHFPEGWYPTDANGDRLRWWDGASWTSKVVTRKPGWYEHPEGSGTRVFFDGSQWTSRIRRRASARAFGLMATIVASGIAVVVWGGFVATAIPAWSYPTELRDFYCSGDHDSELLAGIGQLWLIWLLLAILAVGAVLVWTLAGRGDWLMRSLAVMGVLSAMALCPLWLMFGSAADCGL